jgi:chromosome segregation ATPase
MISSVEDLRTELADARREVSKCQATAESVERSGESQRERDAELHKQALAQQKNHEATRLSELRRSFDERCRALVNEKSTMAERFEEKMAALTAQLTDVRARASAVVADAENASQETSARLAEMQDKSGRSRARAEVAEEALAVLKAGKEEDARERDRLQARIDDLQGKVRALETELNQSRQKEEIAELKRKLAAATQKAEAAEVSFFSGFVCVWACVVFAFFWGEDFVVF